MRRRPTPAPLLEYFPDGLTTQEVAALLADENDPPDRNAAKVALLELVGAGIARAQQLADDALWTANSRSSGRDHHHG